VRLLKRFASSVVLAFDADAAGQGAAQRFYEWEERYKVQVRVAHFPQGKDPGDLSVSDPEALRDAVEKAEPFLGFRLNRVLTARPLRSPEDRARVASDAMAIVNEHPNQNVRTLYAGQVAAHVGLPVADLVALAAKGVRSPMVHVAPTRRAGDRENAEFAAIALLLQQWDDVAPYLIESLFADDVARRAFVSVSAAQGDIDGSLAAADPEAREYIERALVADLDVVPEIEVRALIAAAVRRELARHRTGLVDSELRALTAARVLLESLEDPRAAQDAADQLLLWLGDLAGENGEPHD
jgi:DNA primase